MSAPVITPEMRAKVEAILARPTPPNFEPTQLFHDSALAWMTKNRRGPVSAVEFTTRAMWAGRNGELAHVLQLVENIETAYLEFTDSKDDDVLLSRAADEKVHAAIEAVRDFFWRVEDAEQP